jgi:maltooligosyltrehalose trehalohydrolase
MARNGTIEHAGAPAVDAVCGTGALGAHTTARGSAFRVYAPRVQRVAVVLEASGAAHPMTRAPDGYWQAHVDDIRAGSLYRYEVDGARYPDPCSRFQPQGPHGPSMIVDPAAYAWHDADWRGVAMQGQVVYELHVGTFTPQGTFDAAIGELERLRSLGITLIELMPVAEFPGRWNWGYDGVALFAPYHGYGDCHALRRFVDAAHAARLGVVLDVVYNHLGPDGNYLRCYSADYFTDRHKTDWGEALNFDGPDAAPVRDFFVRNAVHWIAEHHLDGLRLDATQNVYDTGRPHILAELTRAARAAAATRSIVVIGENEPQRVEALMPAERGGWGLDALWNDDFHHCARVALTGRRDGYYNDYRGHAQELVSATRHGFLFQGQRYQWQQKPRGTPVTDEPAAAFVDYIENHDQVANTLDGARLRASSSAGRYRAMTALLLLGPQTPMLFMGQEFGSSRPFRFFADHGPALAARVYEGRRAFLRQFESYATGEAQRRVPDPADPETFLACKLDRDGDWHDEIAALTRDLIALRQRDAVIAQQRRNAIDGAVLSMRAFALRWRDDGHGDRLLVVNLGEDLDFRPAPEPLLAPPRGAAWTSRWSSDDPRYGGPGAVDPCTPDGWRLQAECATLLVATSTAKA